MLSKHLDIISPTSFDVFTIPLLTQLLWLLPTIQVPNRRYIRQDNLAAFDNIPDNIVRG